MKIEIGTGFPVLGIESPAQLARILGLDLVELLELADSAPSNYRPRCETKPGGGTRKIDRPVGRLKTIQRRIYRRLLKQLPISASAHGGVPGRSHVSAARVHLHAHTIATIDIRTFFSSVTNDHVYSLFTEMSCSPDVARLLTLLTTFEGHLAQGSPASTAIANILLVAFDRVVASHARSLDVHYTRVVDDAALSGTCADVSAMVGVVISEIRRLRLHPHRKKTKVMANGHRKTVCNLSVSSRLSLPKRKTTGGGQAKPALSRHALRSQVRAAQRFGLTSSDRRRLAGKIAYARILHPAFADDLLVKLQSARVKPNP